MRVGAAGHGDRAALVLQAVLRLVLDRLAGFLFVHAGGEAAALDHEAVDDAVENRAVVVAFLCVPEKILHRARSLFRIQFNDHPAEAGLHFDARRRGYGGGNRQCGDGKQGFHQALPSKTIFQAPSSRIQYWRFFIWLFRLLLR